MLHFFKLFKTKTLFDGIVYIMEREREREREREVFYERIKGCIQEITTETIYEEKQKWKYSLL